jgi:hypothetical protein
MGSGSADFILEEFKRISAMLAGYIEYRTESPSLGVVPTTFSTIRSALLAE